MIRGDPEQLAPAFYGGAPGERRGALADWWVLLHPPYTLWHLSYVAIGASIAPRFDGGRFAATLLAFLLAVGIGAHALDELKGRPLRTQIRTGALVAAAVVSVGLAVVIGAIGVGRVGLGLGVFIVVGVVLNCGYNLELFGGRLHNDVTFAAAWGAFPVVTAYWAQAETLRLPVVPAAAAAYFLSAAQRSLSTQARSLRRRVAVVHGTATFHDGQQQALTRASLLAPIEAALKAMSVGVVACGLALVLYRCLDG